MNSDKQSAASKLLIRIQKMPLDKNLSSGVIGHELVKYLLSLCELDIPTDVLQAMGYGVWGTSRQTKTCCRVEGVWVVGFSGC